MTIGRIFVAGALALAASAAFAQSKELRIAHVYGKTGALEAYAKQTQAGLQLGLEYATGGKMDFAGMMAARNSAPTRIAFTQIPQEYGSEWM